MVKEENIRAKLDFQEGLRKFKEDAMKQGWEEDEVQEKISEVFVSKLRIVIFFCIMLTKIILKIKTKYQKHNLLYYFFVCACLFCKYTEVLCTCAKVKKYKYFPVFSTYWQMF